VRAKNLQRIVVAIDPAVTSNDNSATIQESLRLAKGVDGRGYLLDDLNLQAISLMAGFAVQ
jgi:phage terminase large subunit-like protein